MTAKERGKACLNGAVVVSADYMKGVHDAQFVIVKDKAYIVYEANDVRPNENPTWEYIYCAMSVVDLNTLKVEKIYKISQSEQKYDDITLEKGCTFVPRIVRLNDDTLRVFFTSEAPSVRPSKTYTRDFDLTTGEFSPSIYEFKIKTPLGVFPLNNKTMLDAVTFLKIPARDVNPPFTDCCTFILDIFAENGKTYAVVNCFWTGINALCVFNDDFTMLETIGFIGEHSDQFRTTESGVVKTPDGSYLAILREDQRFNYVFSESEDGVSWSKVHYSPLIKNGANSKPVLRKLDGKYYLGYNHSDDDKPTYNRNNFTLLTSPDCKNWTEFIEFNSTTSFQYPTFEHYYGKIYFCASQGDKEQIIFGVIEP